MSRVIITIDDVPTGETVKVKLTFPRGRAGVKFSTAESVAEDFKTLIAGEGLDSMLNDYFIRPKARGNLRLVPKGTA